MPTLIQHTETEYDFTMTYRVRPAPAVGVALVSPVFDDDGGHYFEGSAVVVARECKSFPENHTIVYVKQYPPL